MFSCPCTWCTGRSLHLQCFSRCLLAQAVLMLISSARSAKTTRPRLTLVIDQFWFLCRLDAESPS